MAKSTTKDVCQVICFNKDKVNKIKKAMPPQENLNILVEIFKAISDNSRAKILLALKEGELCVCDISHILSLSLSAVSHQLRILRNLRLVKYRNEGRMAFYSLADKHIVTLIEEGMKHII
jgi:DNA-binding transcriptional ArsR family regulator